MITLRYKSAFTATSRERHQSAPYLRLKIANRTSKCQVFSPTVPKNSKGESNWRAESGTIWNFLTSFLLQSINDPSMALKKFLKKKTKNEKSHSAVKCKRGTLCVFSTSLLLQNIKNWKGPFGDPLVLFSFVCYAKKGTTIRVQFPVQFGA